MVGVVVGSFGNAWVADKACSTEEAKISKEDFFLDEAMASACSS